MNFHWTKHTLHFQRPSGTSRGVLKTKPSWYLIGEDDSFQLPAIGECSIIEGLSPDNLAEFESKLDHVCAWLNGEAEKPLLTFFPAIRFGVEMLHQDMQARGTKIFSENGFTTGKESILTNGLIWMGDPEFQKEQLKQKISDGFECIKIKVGAIDFEQELELLRWIRTEFKREHPEIRLDANGAFALEEVGEKLNRLSEFDIHSIEQPIKAGQWEAMANLRHYAPIPIALDEELIGHTDEFEQHAMLESIRPDYIILKPSLVGGLEASDQWIAMAEELDLGWWITSALESNIGLNAIAQYTFAKGVSMPQGLGTGGLFTNNFDSPLYLQGQFLRMRPTDSWNITPLLS